MSTDWSLDEVELIVADYFAMLRAELSGHPVNKAEHNKRLREQLNGRSRGSVEFKHANISAVLLKLDDLPGIKGYKPRGNYQALLEQVVLQRLSAEPDFFDTIVQSPVVQPTAAPPTDFSDLAALVEPPPEFVARPARREPGSRLVKVDFVALDARNRQLGRMGEEWALEYEARRLHDVENRPDLARRIVLVSETEGDGAGYDIRSFNADASPRLVEVKTTGLAKYFPFAVTANEVRVSEREAPHYHLYRLFNFASEAKLYMLPGALSASCDLDPTMYAARAR
jgi:hypothetical protein